MAKKKNHRTPPVGREFVKQYKGREHKMTVVKEGHAVAYKYSGRTFQSPSGAAKFIAKREVNGWVFWGIIRNPR